MSWRDRAWARGRKPAGEHPNEADIREIRAMIDDAKGMNGGTFNMLHFSCAMKTRYDLKELPTLSFCRRVLESSRLMTEVKRAS